MGQEHAGAAGTIIHTIRSASTTDSGWRPARTAAIAERCTMLGDTYAYAAFTLRNFGKAELAELSDHELERTWRHVQRRRLP